jgi:hypothetical protein
MYRCIDDMKILLVPSPTFAFATFGQKQMWEIGSGGAGGETHIGFVIMRVPALDDTSPLMFLWFAFLDFATCIISDRCIVPRV